MRVNVLLPLKWAMTKFELYQCYCGGFCWFECEKTQITDYHLPAICICHNSACFSKWCKCKVYFNSLQLGSEGSVGLHNSWVQQPECTMQTTWQMFGLSVWSVTEAISLAITPPTATLSSCRASSEKHPRLLALAHKCSRGTQHGETTHNIDIISITININTGPWVSVCFIVPTFPHTLIKFQNPPSINALCQSHSLLTQFTVFIWPIAYSSNWSYEVWDCEKQTILKILNDNKESRCDCEIHAIVKTFCLHWAISFTAPLASP